MRKGSLVRSTAKAQTSLRNSAVRSVTQPAALIMYSPKGMPRGTGFAQCSTTIVPRRIADIAANSFFHSHAHPNFKESPMHKDTISNHHRTDDQIQQ